MAARQYENDYTKLIEQVKTRRIETNVNKSCGTTKYVSNETTKDNFGKAKKCEGSNDNKTVTKATGNEYLFNIVEVDSDRTLLKSAPVAKYPVAVSKENKINTSTSTSVRSSKGDTSVKSKAKVNTSRNSKKKTPVKTRNIGSFFQIRTKQEIVSPDKKTLSSIKIANEKVPIIDADDGNGLNPKSNSEVITIRDNDEETDTVSVCTPKVNSDISNIPDSPFYGSQTTPSKDKLVNSTAIGGKAPGVSSSITNDISPICFKLLPSSRRHLLSKYSKRAASFSLESKQLTPQPKNVQILEYDTDNSNSSDENSLSLFDNDDEPTLVNTDTNDDDVSSLTSEISYLVEKAVKNPSKFISNDSETDSCDETQGVIPKPPSNLNFSEFASP